MVNPFLANVPILYPLKTPENQKFSGVFRGHKMGTLARNGLKTILSNILDTWKRTLTERQFSLFSSSSFLNTGITSANLSLFGKQPLSNEVLSNFNKHRDVKINADFQYSRTNITSKVCLFSSMFKIIFLTSFSLTEWNLNWHTPLRKEKFP